MKHTWLYRLALCLPVLFLFCAPPAVPGGPLPPPEQTALQKALLLAWQTCEPVIQLPAPLPLEELEAAYFALLDSAADCFWVDSRFSYTAGAEGVLSVTPHYLCTPDEIGQLRDAFDRAADRLLAAVPAHGSDYAAAYALHGALAAVAAYGPENAALGPSGAYTAYGALVEGRAVCRGYAMAYRTLLKRAGIPSTYVRSAAMGHGWVQACLDGRWLHIDVTWDDITPLSHRHFARTDRAMTALGYTDFCSRH